MAFRYSYQHVSDVLSRPFIVAGAVLGSLYPMYTSTERDTFTNCVGSAGVAGTLGAIGGLAAAHLHPVILGAVVVGGPTWAYQRLRFPSEEAIGAARLAKAKENLAAIHAAQKELDAVDAAIELAAKEREAKMIESIVQPTVELR